MKEVILDTETTGLSIKEGHRIVEIGCIELNNRVASSNRFHCILNPERKVSEEAFKVHGYSDEFLLKKKKFSEIVDDFLKFIENKKLIIHNSAFDLSHLNNELNLVGKKNLDKTQVIDTLEIAKEKFPGAQINLDALCKRFRIDNSKREKHTALIDCELLSKVYINLLDQKEPKLNFNNFNEIRNKENYQKAVKYSKKIIPPSSDELKNHKEFLKKNFKKNYF